jgi:predicted DNA-binding ribbon-helix-helix protein
VLSQIAAEDGMTTNQLITKLWDEILEWREVPNMASFLRVSCLRYLEARRLGELPRPVALRSV